MMGKVNDSKKSNRQLDRFPHVARNTLFITSLYRSMGEMIVNDRHFSWGEMISHLFMYHIAIIARSS